MTMAMEETAATSGVVPSEKVNSLIIHVNGSEDTAASARSSLLWEKVRNFVPLLNGPKDTLSSTWTGLASYFAALMQQWRDKIIYYMVQRWIVAFCLTAVYIYRAIFIGGLGLVTINSMVWLMFFLGKYLSSPDLPHFIDQPLPVISQAEFKPFVRELREYDLWTYWMRITIVALVMSLFLRLPVGLGDLYTQIFLIGAIVFIFLGEPLRILRHYNQFPFNLVMKGCTGKKSASRCGSLAETKMVDVVHWLRQRWPLHQISTPAETRMVPSSDV
ncbi:protein RER1D-like [Cornus florida]|uniref:protein RER1D-like n=1 Tax=Cornus florida TaxID=4283 RepID=UPI00289758A5|nr:protein RER1D-like [Cornus florida]XP_059652831.1 protein RER1D-like [Cornus florida]